jgi:type IV pilus assembly protein PilF
MLRKSLLFFILFLSISCSSFRKEDQELSLLHLQSGTALLNEGNYPQALSELLTAESLDPENPTIQNNLGLTYFFRERNDLAESHIRKALKLHPEYTDARNNLSRILIERGKYQEAIQEAQAANNDLTYPNPEKPLINLGLAQFKLRQFEISKKTFQKAVEIQRDNCLAQSYYGRSLFELRDYRRAAEALDRAVGFCQRSQFDEPHYYSALSYFELGLNEKAEARFEELLKLYPQGKYVDKAKSMLDTIQR